MTPDLPPSRRSGVTLIEVLVIMAIMAVLAGLLAPAVQAAIGAARSLACRSQLRQIGEAYRQYVSDSSGLWPPILSTEAPTALMDSIQQQTGLVPAPARPAVGWGQPGPHWSIVLWPYLEDLAVFTCPADPQAGLRGDAVVAPGHEHEVAFINAPPESYGLNVILFRTIDDWRRLAGCTWGTHGDADYNGLANFTTLAEQRRQIPAIDQRVLFFCGTSGQTVGSQYNVAFRAGKAFVERWEWHGRPAPAAFVDDPGSGSNYLFGDGHVEYRQPLPDPWEWGYDLHR
jgi:prepilin-type processing-associated H-X9-DG protein